MHKFFLRIIPHLVLLLLVKGVYTSDNASNTTKEVYCEFYNKTMCIESQLNGSFEGCGETMSCGPTVSPNRYNCYAMVSNKDDVNKFTTYMKGCILNGDSCYNKSDCTIQMQNKAGYSMCCCEGDLCNKNIDMLLPPGIFTTSLLYQGAILIKTDIYEIVKSIFSVVDLRITIPASGDKIVMSGLVTASVFVSLVLSFYIIGYIFGHTEGMREVNRGSTVILRKKVTVEAKRHVKPEDDSDLNLINVSSIGLKEEKARGQFGTLWKALYKDKEVAVKIFPKEHEKTWKTEKNIFKSSIRDHVNIVQMIGVGQEQLSEYWLITEFHQFGSLHDYLIDHTVSWTELCLIAETMTRGLARLHELDYSGNKKPIIAHRDFKSTSVLLKNDLTACISDFTSAVTFNNDAECGDHYFQSGTTRYMAPEVLEGAIIFRPTSFLRIDMYACALVLWELVSRCTVICGPVLEYKLPYEDEVGKSPNLEDMKRCVLQRKLRPIIQDAWITHSGLKELCNTIEDCWDYDAEARLTSACVMERIVALTRPKLEKEDFVVDVENGPAVINESTSVEG